MNVWHGLKTSISRAGTAVNAVGLSPRFEWTLQLRFWRSTAPHKGDSRSTTVFQLQRSPRLGLKQPENSNATPNEIPIIAVKHHVARRIVEQKQSTTTDHATKDWKFRASSGARLTLHPKSHRMPNRSRATNAVRQSFR